MLNRRMHVWGAAGVSLLFFASGGLVACSESDADVSDGATSSGGLGGAAAGVGGGSAAGTGGSAAGTGGSAAGTGGSAAGTGGSAAGTGGSAADTTKLQVFILAGQSNMEGQGEMYSEKQGDLEYLTQNDPEGTFAHLVDSNGDWTTRDDVWMYYKRGGETELVGDLTVGYGANDTTIGPELQFGHVMGDALENQVLLIKTAWGGKSLAVDFRPPSSGGEVGPYYTQMISTVEDVLDNLSTHFPDYDGSGYEIAGFGWFQGWNDLVNGGHVSEYEANLKNLIVDTREAFGVDDLPFVVGLTGMHGSAEAVADKPWEWRVLNTWKAQFAVADPAQYPEFEGNVFTVDTRPHLRDPAVSPADQQFHWHRNAETYFLIGNDMAEAMKDLTGR